MRIAKTAVALLLGIALVIVLIGFILPVDHVASVSAEYDAPAHAVWEAIVTVEAFPAWRSDVTRVEITSEEGAALAWREHGSNGSIPFRIERAEEPRSLVTRIDTDALPFGGSWTYEIEPLGETRTRLTITENGEVYNPVFRFVSRFLIGHTATIEAYQSALHRRLR